MQDVFFVAFWYIADVVYAAYAVWDIAKDCDSEYACVIRDSLEFLEVTALASLVFSPIYAIPMILSALLHMSWLLIDVIIAYIFGRTPILSMIFGE